MKKPPTPVHHFSRSDLKLLAKALRALRQHRKLSPSEDRETQKWEETIQFLENCFETDLSLARGPVIVLPPAVGLSTDRKPIRLCAQCEKFPSFDSHYCKVCNSRPGEKDLSAFRQALRRRERAK